MHTRLIRSCSPLVSKIARTPSSLRQAEAAEHILEARVRTQEVEFGSGLCLDEEVIFMFT